MANSERVFYVVGHNMAGYMPDGEPYIMRNKRDAIRTSREDAIRDMEAYNDCVLRSERYHMSGKEGDYWLTSAHLASYHYWVTPVSGELAKAGPYVGRCVACDMSIAQGEDVWVIDGWFIHHFC